jgi:hypothetical protein
MSYIGHIGGVRVITSTYALEKTKERLFPESRQCSPRKKLIKRLRSLLSGGWPSANHISTCRISICSRSAFCSFQGRGPFLSPRVLIRKRKGWTAEIGYLQ